MTYKYNGHIVDVSRTLTGYVGYLDGDLEPQAMTIRQKFDEYVSHRIFEPRYAQVSVVWKDDKRREDRLVISLTDYHEDEDDHIFYYCGSVGDLESLTDEDGMQDFFVIADSVEFFEKL